MSASLAQSLAIVTATMCRHGWENRDVDASLLQRLEDCLVILGASAFIARYVREGVTLGHAPAMAQVSDEVLGAVAAELTKGLSARDLISYRRVGDLFVIGTAIPGRRVDDEGGNAIVGYTALCFSAACLPEGSERDLMITFHGYCTSALLWYVLQQRVRVFLSLAPGAAEEYWMMARRRTRETPRVPPWETEGGRTVTLGFDLRKSTFCMEKADDPKKFALWLDEMVEILRRIAHYYSAIFDKFTGDGVLVHFPVRFSDPNDFEAVTGAVLCSIAMQKAIEEHLIRLRRFLRLDSKVLGGGIGIDVAHAFWKLDDRDNPIVVGRGVVDACRLMDGTKARRIRLTNIAYQALDGGGLKKLFKAASFTSKEVDRDMEVQVWELDDALGAPLLPADEHAVAAICKAVWSRWR